MSLYKQSKSSLKNLSATCENSNISISCGVTSATVRVRPFSRKFRENNPDASLPSHSNDVQYHIQWRCTTKRRYPSVQSISPKRQRLSLSSGKGKRSNPSEVVTKTYHLFNDILQMAEGESTRGKRIKRRTDLDLPKNEDELKYPNQSIAHSHSLLARGKEKAIYKFQYKEGFDLERYTTIEDLGMQNC